MHFSQANLIAGIYESAVNTLNAVREPLLRLHGVYSAYGIKIVGHSLGAGSNGIFLTIFTPDFCIILLRDGIACGIAAEN